MRLICITFLFASLAAIAQTPAADPVGKFVSWASTSRSICGSHNLEIDLEADTARMRGAGLPVDRYLAGDQCARDAETKLKPMFEAAKAARPDLTPMLFDYFVETIAFLKADRPQPGETRAARERRVRPIEQGLARMQTKLNLMQ
jgi:hypothetical protein